MKTKFLISILSFASIASTTTDIAQPKKHCVSESKKEQINCMINEIQYIVENIKLAEIDERAEYLFTKYRQTAGFSRLLFLFEKIQEYEGKFFVTKVIYPLNQAFENIKNYLYLGLNFEKEEKLAIQLYTHYSGCRDFCIMRSIFKKIAEIDKKTNLEEHQDLERKLQNLRCAAAIGISSLLFLSCFDKNGNFSI